MLFLFNIKSKKKINLSIIQFEEIHGRINNGSDNFATKKITQQS